MATIVAQPPVILHREIGRYVPKAAWRARRWIVFGAAALAVAASRAAAPGQATAAADASSRPTVPDAASRAATALPISVPRLQGRLTAKDIGLVVNTADPYSVAVGAYYQKARRLDDSQVLRVALPVRPVLTLGEFRTLQVAIADFFGKRAEALALAWRAPFAVECNSITGALALGFDAGLCTHTCAASTRSPYFNAATARPFSERGLRPSMLLAAADVHAAQALIDRGVAADGRLGLRGAPPVSAYYLKTHDTVRSARAPLFPPAGLIARFNVDVRVESADAIENVGNVLIYETGLASVPHLGSIGWAPGALADHLTSFGGVLDGSGGQMPATDWLAAGATASYGTVSEPCAHPQKFPHPQVLLLNYLQGATAIEAYWKSVAWPQQGVFVGEPLAAPFARR